MNQQNTLFVLIGGFLGAGKTTTISRLARMFVDSGKRVGIVTNDQTTELVDTLTLQSQGFDVGEVAGACFCCGFNELISTVEQLNRDAMPEVILAEPVGSCTDLVATVIRPLEQVYERPLKVAPFGVIMKPSHGAKILANDSNGGFSPQAAYIFRKQLEEADFILVNRIDELEAERLSELTQLVEEQFPDRPFLAVSARSGAGFDEVFKLIQSDSPFIKRTMDLDYDRYAEGEAELGWLNCQCTFQADQKFELDSLIFDTVRQLQDQFNRQSLETAHLKAIGMGEGQYAVANAVSSFTRPELSLPSHCQTRQAQVVVNARVATRPESLERLVREQLQAVAQAINGRHTIETLQCFSPARPVPTHRIVEAS